MKKILSLALFLAFLPVFVFAQEKPWPNTTIIGALNGYNPRLQDDFYAAVNRDWLLTAKIPQGYPRIDSFTERSIQIKEELHSLMTDKSLKGLDAQNVRNLYDLFLDWEGRKNSGVAELKEIIQNVKNLKNLQELNDWFCGDECIYKGAYPCGLVVETDIKDKSKKALTVYPTGLTLQDSAEYKKLTENGKNQKEFSDAVSLHVLTKIGFSGQEADKIIAQKYQFESALASTMMTTDDYNSPKYFEMILNERTLGQLQELSPAFPLVQSIKALGMDKTKRIYLAEPAWLKKMNEIYSEENIGLVKAWLIDKIARNAVYYLDRESYDFFNKARAKRYGIADAPNDTQNAVDFVADALVVPLSKLYAANCVDKNAKKRVTKIVKQTIAEYKKLLAGQDWLCAETKKKAIQKVSATKIRVAYPSRWDDWSALKISSAKEGESFFSAVQKVRVFRTKQELSNVGKKYGSGMWIENVFQVNAFNEFTSNSIKIIAGIIGGAFYHPDMTDEELYGGLGAVIGHEISHSFDATGSQFDKEGEMNNWWTEEDLEAFKARSKKIADRFNGMTTFGSTRQNGEAVQGEAAADIGGVKVMLALAKKKPEFNYKLFFESYARVWKAVISREFAGVMLNDPHPYANLRTNVTLQQFDEFIETYGIKPGDKMYLAPQDRISIW